MSETDSNTLAVFGGRPAFDEPLHIGRPNLGSYERFEERVRAAWNRKWLTNDGPLVRELEQRVVDQFGVRNCIAVCNATVGLEIAVRALDLTGEIILPSLTFIASAHCLTWQRLKPIFSDVEPVSRTIDPEQVEKLINEKTSGIMGVHLWGQPCLVDELTEIARRHDIKLLFDASHALGNTWNNRFVGNFGECEVFSLHATKFVNSFEGGLITTNSDELAARIRLMRNFGFAGYDDVACIGTNGKMCEVAAAMGLTSLDAMEAIMSWNQMASSKYKALLGKLPGIRCLEISGENSQYVVAEVDTSTFGLTRDQLLCVLHAENVLARRYFFPGCHQSAPYRGDAAFTPRPLPVTETLLDRVLQLPTGTAVTERDILQIVQIIEKAHEHAEVLRNVINPVKSVGTM